MASLYELTANANTLYELLQNDEIDEQTFNDTLEAMETDEKVESYCKIIKQLQGDTELFKNEISRLRERKRTTENAIERMKKSLLSFLQATGQTRTKAGTFSISISNTTAVNITNENLIPSDFISLIPEIDKIAIKERIKSGLTVPGAELIINAGVRIR